MSALDGCMADGTATDSHGDGPGTPGDTAAPVPDTFAALVERFCAGQAELRAMLERAAARNGGRGDEPG